MLTGPMVVARDIAHAKIKERLDAGDGMPEYLQRLLRVLRRAGQDARGLRVGFVRPDHRRTHGHLRRPVPGRRRQLVMLAKGNRSQAVTDACKEHGGFYLGSIGGPAARLAQDCITKVEVLEYPELGMEAVWKIEVATSPRSSSSTTRATTSSPRCRSRPRSADPPAGSDHISVTSSAGR